MTQAGGSPPNPAPLIQLSTAYWGSQTLFAANRLGIFPALAAGERSAHELAGELGLAPRHLDLLLRTLVSLGLLERGEAGFRNAAVAQAFLVPGNPGYLGDAIRYGEDMYAPWGELAEAVRSGAPTLDPGRYLGGEEERTRHFVRGMHNRALGVGRVLAEIADLSGCRRLLDVGGGPGTYSALFAARYPELWATVLDLPEVVQLAEEILMEMPGGERVETLGGDYHRAAFPAGHDAVLISGVLHRETPDACRDLIRRAANCLEPGGVLHVADVFADAGGTGPAFALLFGLNMALSAPDGGMHADADVAAWLGEAGFVGVEVQPFPGAMPHRLVSGRKP